MATHSSVGNSALKGSSQDVDIAGMEATETNLEVQMDHEYDDEEQSDEEGASNRPHEEIQDEAVPEEEEEDFAPELSKTQLTKEQKIAFQTSLGSWDSKLNTLLEKKTQELEAQIPATKKK